MAISSMYSFLMHSTDGTAYTKLVDIKDFSDLSQPPEALDTTTLTDYQRTHILGIQESDNITFTCNYVKADFTTLAALENTEGYYAVWLGGTESGGTVTPNGDQGKFSFKGYLTVTKSGAGVNEVQNMVVTIAASTPVVLS